MGLLPSGGCDRRQGRRSTRTARIVAWEFDNWNSGGSGHPHALRGSQSAYPVSRRRTRRFARARTAAWPRPRITTRAKCTWTPSRAPLTSIPLEFRLQHLKDERMRAVLDGGGARSSAGRNRRRPAAGSVSRAAPRRAATSPPPRKSPRRERVHASSASSRRFECGAIVNPDGLNNQVEGSVDSGPRRRALRGDRVRRRRHRQRHHGALPRAALQGYSAHRDRFARSEGSAIGGSRGDADRVRRPRHRIRGARVRHGGRGAARAVGVIVPEPLARGGFRLQAGRLETAEGTNKTNGFTQPSVSVVYSITPFSKCRPRCRATPAATPPSDRRPLRAARDVAGQQRHGSKEHDDRRIGERVGGLYAEQLAAQQPVAARLAAMPTPSPTRTSRPPIISIRPSTWLRGAPSAMRRPSSCVRSVTWNDSTL